MKTITINGHEVPLGCHVDGHHGQYGPDRLADIVDTLLPDDGHDYPERLRESRRMAERLAEYDGVKDTDTRDLARRQEAEWWENFHWYADRCLDVLNDHTPDGYHWSWEDGELFLQRVVEVGDLVRSTGAVWEVLSTEPDACGASACGAVCPHDEPVWAERVTTDGTGDRSCLELADTEPVPCRASSLFERDAYFSGWKVPEHLHIVETGHGLLVYELGGAR